MRYDNKCSIERKCNCCGKSINISKDNIDEAIYYDKKNYHSSCFIKMCEEKSVNKRCNTEKWKSLLDNLSSIQNQSRSYLSEAIEKDATYQFILEKYNLTILPSTVFQKLSDIYSGTYRGMSKGIPPSHLLDMWERKMDMLNDVANKNVTKGKVFNGTQRVNYDLSILINKYDSYLKWLEKQKILEVEREDNIEDKLNLLTSSIGYKNHDSKNDNDDISDLVDDIFG